MGKMILRHYSKDRFPRIDTTKWGEQTSGMKPCGVWVSDDADAESSWPAWCRAESFQLDHLRFQYRASLHPAANVLCIRSPFEIDAFTAEFAAQPEWARDFSANNWRGYFIDWPAVAARWQGIVITPYQWSRRLDGPARWYYGWDCASGCIWDICAFERFEFEADLGLMLENSPPADA